MLRLVVLAVSFASGAAMAGEQFIDESGYAVSGVDVVRLYETGRSVSGDPAFNHRHNGVTWIFESAETRDRFAADPGRYAPAFDGHCAYALGAKGAKFAAYPRFATVVDGRLFLNFDAGTQSKWTARSDEFIAAADAEWPSLEGDPAANPPRKILGVAVPW